MLRIASLVLAAGFGLAAALLLAMGPTVQVDGETVRCSGIIVSSERGDAPRPGDAFGDEPEVGPCDRAESRWAWYAGSAALLCAITGSVAQLSRRDEETVATRS